RPPVLAKLSGILRRQFIEWPLIEEYLGIFMSTIPKTLERVKGTNIAPPSSRILYAKNPPDA
ncbi:MAG: hypothetical protein KDC70_13845, partial [Saprospiraceae bacterium]|nr:hypothetical protein [Saprospiraceae bacterium]